MAVEQFRNRTDEIVLIGPLDQIYTAAGPIIQDYLNKNWTFQGSKTNPNGGPRMDLKFTKERD